LSSLEESEVENEEDQKPKAKEHGTPMKKELLHCIDHHHKCKENGNIREISTKKQNMNCP